MPYLHFIQLDLKGGWTKGLDASFQVHTIAKIPPKMYIATKKDLTSGDFLLFS